LRFVLPSTHADRLQLILLRAASSTTSETRNSLRECVGTARYPDDDRVARRENVSLRVKIRRAEIAGGAIAEPAMRKINRQRSGASIIAHQRTRGFAERARRTQEMARAGSVLLEQSCSVEIFGHGSSLAYRLRKGDLPLSVSVLAVSSDFGVCALMGLQDNKITRVGLIRINLVLAERDYLIVFALALCRAHVFFKDLD
jgi:hypothetical protein